jgi:hypothetical protein
MAILGTWTDRQTVTSAGLATAGTFFVTFPTSLPTIADIANVNPVSIQASTALPLFGVLRSTAATIGTLSVFMPTLASGSTPVFSVEVNQQYVWSPAR